MFLIVSIIQYYIKYTIDCQRKIRITIFKFSIRNEFTNFTFFNKVTRQWSSLNKSKK